MATILCRGLQSCLDSHLVDQRTFIFPSFDLPLKTHLPNSSNSLLDSDQCHIQFHSGAATEGPANERELVYVHPLSKRFGPNGLSEKSLELCTENLGNETGSDIIESDMFSPEIDGEELQRKWEKKSHFHSHSHEFPPPLTTIRETESFSVRPHREEGRLIISAVRTPTRLPCFQAERSGGRLRLCFVETEESEDVNGGEEEVGDEMETAAIMNEENGNNNNGRLNLEQLNIATC